MRKHPTPLRPGPLFLLLVLAGAFLPAPRAGGQQLLQNGDLEKGHPWPWNHPLYGKAVVRMGVAPKEGRNGGPCLFLEGKVPRGIREWYQNVKEGLPREGEVTLSVQVRTEKVARRAWVALRAFQGTRFLAGASTRDTRPLSGDTDWTRLVLTLRLPPGTDRIQVAALLEGKGKVFFDDFLLVPGGVPGVSPREASPPGKEAGPAPAKEKPKGRNGIYLVRCDLELRARKEEKQGRLFSALPALREGQYPFYFKVESLPADGIRSLKVIRKGGRGTRPLLEMKIFPMKAGEKVRIQMETKILVLERSGPLPPLPRALPEKPRFPGKVKPYLSLSRILRPLEKETGKILEAGSRKGKDLPSRLAAFTGAAGRGREAPLLLATALRQWGLPARLVSGVTPGPAPTQPDLAVEAWVPEAGWVLLLPSVGLVRPPAGSFLVFREIPREGEKKRSSVFPWMPYMGFLEAKGRFRIRGLKDPAKGAFLECRPALLLPAPPKDLRAVLIQDLEKNWRRWLKARERGREDAEAEFAGETASQTKDFREMIRILEGG